MSKKKKIGLYFGSFNPIHIGHLAIANIVQQMALLDEVWFVVSPQNPLKESIELLPFEHRFKMVVIALKESDVLFAKDDESLLPLPSYSVQTIKYFEKLHPNVTFSLIMGGDNLDVIHLWKEYEYLLDNYQIYVYDRPGGVDERLYANRVEFIASPQMEISGSYIRDMILKGYKVPYLMPNGVYNYFIENRLHKLI